MKYVSLDIETTGLDKDKHQIVEVGAVLDEIGSTIPIEELPKFRAVLLHDEMTIDTFCANLHRDLWVEALGVICTHKEEIDRSGVVIVNTVYYCLPTKFEYIFHRWLNDMMDLGIEYYSDNGEPLYGTTIKINVAGKNPGTFDIPFLEALPGWQGLVKFRRRVLDPASHCVLPDDERIPDLQECLKRCGFESTVKHTAVDDAIDIIKVIRQQGIGRHVHKSICASCTMPDCSGRDNTRYCPSYIIYTAEESSCIKCDATPACGYLDGRNPNNPCGHFNLL